MKSITGDTHYCPSCRTGFRFRTPPPAYKCTSCGEALLSFELDAGLLAQLDSDLHPHVKATAERLKAALLR